MIRTMATVLMAVLLIAAAPVSTPGTEADRTPDWLLKPDGDQVARYYPDRAQRLNVEGQATILCTIGLDTHLHDCTVVNESPPGFGFGDAAVKLAREMRMTPTIREGLPVEASVRVPIVFKLPESGRAYGPAALATSLMVLAGVMFLFALLGAGFLGGLYLIVGRGRRAG